jgi:hypothetical protein
VQSRFRLAPTRSTLWSASWHPVPVVLAADSCKA